MVNFIFVANSLKQRQIARWKMKDNEKKEAKNKKKNHTMFAIYTTNNYIVISWTKGTWRHASM